MESAEADTSSAPRPARRIRKRTCSQLQRTPTCRVGSWALAGLVAASQLGTGITGGGVLAFHHQVGLPRPQHPPPAEPSRWVRLVPRRCQAPFTLMPLCSSGVALCSVTDSDLESVPSSKVGRPHTAESRAKISAANKGKQPWNKGKGHSEETKARIRERTRQAMEARKREKLAAMGLTVEEYEAMKERNRAEERSRKREAKRNATNPDEFKLKLSARMRELWRDPEYRSRALKHLNDSRAVHNEETRRKISQTMKRIWEEDRYPRNRTITEDTRRKISEKLKAIYADPEFRKNLTSTRKRDPEHNRKIAEAIRRKWAEEGYKNKTLLGIQTYQSNYVDTRYDSEGKLLSPAPQRFRARMNGDIAVTPRRRRNTTSSTPRARRTPSARSGTAYAQKKRLLRAELEGLERMDREMRGEIKPRKDWVLARDRKPAVQKSAMSELIARQAMNIWDQMYSQDEDQMGLASVFSTPAPGIAAAGSAVETGSELKGEGEGEEGEGQEAEDEDEEEEVDESDVQWEQYLEKLAQRDAEEWEMRKRIRDAKSRTFDGAPLTDVFRLVDGKVAVVSAANLAPQVPPAEADEGAAGRAASTFSSFTVPPPSIPPQASATPPIRERELAFQGFEGTGSVGSRRR